MIEDLKDAINRKREKIKHTGYVSEIDRQDDLLFLTLAEAAVESGGKLGSPVASPSPFSTHESGLAEGYNAAIVSCIPAFALLTAELAEAKRERDAYKKAKQENDERFMIERDEARAENEKLKALTISEKITLADYLHLCELNNQANTELTRLAAFEARAKGIKESDIRGIIIAHCNIVGDGTSCTVADEQCAAAVLALYRGE